MSETALYRKYRPKTFDEVRGQDELVRALKGAIAQHKIGHAYLFVGSRGIGKTTLARIFAREIGTKDRDLVEIDAASNRGIDDIRVLREEVHVLPFESPYKVYVIDEVHMLTKDAWNALLKTLEEPPRHVVFILATTEVSKIPETIISRCQMFSLKRPSTELIASMVTDVAMQEGYTLESGCSELIALLADGAFRDAHGILQKVLSVGTDKNITLEELQRITGSPRSSYIISLINAVAEKNLDESLAQVRMLALSEVSMQTVALLLIRFVRGVLIIRTAPTLAQEIKSEHSKEEWDAMTLHAKNSATVVNSVCLRRLLAVSQETGSTYIASLPLELALIEHTNA